MRDLVTKKRGLASKLAARLGTWLRSHKATSKLGQLLYSDVKAARDAYVRLLGESREAQGKGQRDAAVTQRYSFSGSESGRANDALLSYDNELRSLIESRGDIIVDDYESLKTVVDLAFDDRLSKATAYFGIISSDMLDDIQRDIPNIPRELEGKIFKRGRDYSVAVTLDSIRHMVDEKGLSRNDVTEYLDKLADTIMEYDTVSYSPYVRGQSRTTGLLFEKTFNDAKYASYELVSHSSRSLIMQSLYMDGGDYQKKKSAETLPVRNAHGFTSETRVGQTSTDSISQTSSESQDENSDNIRYSYESGGEGDDTSERFSSLLIKENMRQVGNMKPVRSLKGTEFAKSDVDLVTQVTEFFDNIGNVENRLIGRVVLNKIGVKSDIAHGIGRNKAISFKAVPNVIENGRVVDYQTNWKGRGYDTAVIAAPIRIGKDEFIMGCVVTRKNGSNLFYLHEVAAITKDGESPFKTGSSNESNPGGDAPSVFSILQKIIDVKGENEFESIESSIDARRSELDLSPQQRKANERRARAQDRALEAASREAEPKGYRGMSDEDVRRAEAERDRDVSGSFVREGDGERRIDLSRTLGEFAEEQSEHAAGSALKEYKKMRHAESVPHIFGAGGGNRTRTGSLGSCNSTTKLRLRMLNDTTPVQKCQAKKRKSVPQKMRQKVFGCRTLSVRIFGSICTDAFRPVTGRISRKAICPPQKAERGSRPVRRRAPKDTACALRERSRRRNRSASALSSSRRSRFRRRRG